jgi:hypothetical protein
MTAPKCVGETSLFYSEVPADLLKSKELCSECAYVTECLIKALRNREVAGVWGGFSPEERRSILYEIARRVEVLNDSTTSQ